MQADCRVTLDKLATEPHRPLCGEVAICVLSANSRHSMLLEISHPNDCCTSEPAGRQIHTTRPEQSVGFVAYFVWHVAVSFHWL